MSTIISSPIVVSTKKIRPSTPIRRRCLASIPCNLPNNTNIKQALVNLIDLVKDSSDSSTQLLIRLYQHKSLRLIDEPEKFYLFQQEIYSGLRRLHPSIQNQENHLIINSSQPIITCRSAQATIRKLH